MGVWLQALSGLRRFELLGARVPWVGLSLLPSSLTSWCHSLWSPWQVGLRPSVAPTSPQPVTKLTNRSTSQAPWVLPEVTRRSIGCRPSRRNLSNESTGLNTAQLRLPVCSKGALSPTKTLSTKSCRSPLASRCQVLKTFFSLPGSNAANACSKHFTASPWRQEIAGQFHMPERHSLAPHATMSRTQLSLSARHCHALVEPGVQGDSRRNSGGVARLHSRHLLPWSEPNTLQMDRASGANRPMSTAGQQGHKCHDLEVTT